MPLPLLPLGMLLLTGGAFAAKTIRDKKNASPELAANRRAVYDNAINNIKDPAKLRRLAQAFKDEGMDAEAKALILRAENAEASPEVKAQRKEIFRQGMESSNPIAIRNLADAFESKGAPSAAIALRERADGLESIPSLDEQEVISNE